MFRRMFRPLAVVIGCLVLICTGAELAYVGYFSDFSYLMDLRECEEQIGAETVGGNGGLCPLGNGTSYVRFGTSDNLTRVTVVAADRELFHSKKTSLFFPRYLFAVVLLSNGKIAHWVGNRAEYQEAISAAESSIDARNYEVFFQNSDQDADFAGLKRVSEF